MLLIAAIPRTTAGIRSDQRSTRSIDAPPRDVTRRGCPNTGGTHVIAANSRTMAGLRSDQRRRESTSGGCDNQAVTPTVAIDVRMSIDVEQPGEMALCVGVSAPEVRETLAVSTAEGAAVAVRDLRTDAGRTQILGAQPGRLYLSYRAQADLTDPAAAPLGEVDALVYRRPSRYCPSDRLAGLAAAQFGGLEPGQVPAALEEWLYTTVAYVPGTTDAADDALHPLLTRTGVCRDFAHLGVAMCRALGIPARYTAVYAPGLHPMDFHAVFEAAIDGAWYVFDGTRLAPRGSLVRIASGRDAADTALLTPLGAVVGMVSPDLTVTTSGDLPFDDRSALVALA